MAGLNTVEWVSLYLLYQPRFLLSNVYFYIADDAAVAAADKQPADVATQPVNHAPELAASLNSLVCFDYYLLFFLLC